MGPQLNSHFTKEDIGIANKYMKNYSASLVNRKCKLKPH